MGGGGGGWTGRQKKMCSLCTGMHMVIGRGEKVYCQSNDGEGDVRKRRAALNMYPTVTTFFKVSDCKNATCNEVNKVMHTNHKIENLLQYDKISPKI